VTWSLRGSKSRSLRASGAGARPTYPMSCRKLGSTAAMAALKVLVADMKVVEIVLDEVSATRSEADTSDWRLSCTQSLGALPSKRG
jgi:hypothetical protein